MKPYYEADGVTIYHGDCREILPHVGSVDLVLTDPPYGVAYVTAWRLRTDPLRSAVVGDDGNLAVFSGAWPLALEALAHNRHWYVFASPLRIPEMTGVVGRPKHILAWDKGDRGTVGDLTAGFGESWEAVFYGMKGRRELYGGRPRTTVRVDWSSTMDPVHPTVKPVSLLQFFVGWSTRVGEVVLDMFAGSGTTLAAAKNLGRKAIGIEIEERYCEVAAQRLAQTVLEFEA